MLLRNILLISFFLLMVTVFPILAKATPDFSGCDINITNSSTTYTINQNNTVYCLNESINLEDSDGVIFSADVQNTTLDCLGYDIDAVINEPLTNYGVYLPNSSIVNNTIKNCIITNFLFGINLYLSSNNTFINNTFNNNSQGTNLESSSDNTFINNTFSNNSNGIAIFWGSNNTLINNTFYSMMNYSYFSLFIYGSSDNYLVNNSIQAYHNSIHNQQGLIILGENINDFRNNINESNTINGLPILYMDGISRACSNNTVYANGSSYSYMGFVGCDNITIRDSSPTDHVLFASTVNSTIENLNISFTVMAIDLQAGANFTNIINNTVENNIYSIILDSSSNNTITNNTANNSDIGFYISRSSNNTITNNTAKNNNWGIELDFSSNNTIVNNTIRNNNYGIFFQHIYNNSIIGGSIDSSSQYDYYLIWTDETNKFTNTNFTDSRKIYFDVSSAFNYCNDSSSNICLKTNASEDITRELINWNQSMMIWNDTSVNNITAIYNVTGLLANTHYNIFNDSIFVQSLQSDGSGNLPSFTIYLASEHEIKVIKNNAPLWSNNTSFIQANYSSITFDAFFIKWNDDINVSNVFITIKNSTSGDIIVNNTSMLYCPSGPCMDTYGANYNYTINLPPGTYNWTSYANDTSGNWNSTPTWMMEGTKGKGTPTLTLMIDGTEADKSVAYGTTTTVAVTESNGGDSDVNYTFYRGSSVIPTSPNVETLSEGTYVYVYNSTGGTNWSSSSVTRTLNVTAATFTPSSPGSSGPASTPSTKVSVKKGEANITIPSIAAGKSTNVTIAKTEDVAVRQINISVSNPVNNIKIIITKLPGSPASVTHIIEGKVYHYIQIDKSNITDSDLNKAYIKFAINKTWLTINGVDKTNMALYRWANDKWNELTTTYVSEDSLEVFYQAETPGFSYFLIGTKGGEVTTQAPTGEAITCTESWSCTDWSACNNSQQTKTCTDTNNCGTIAIKPEESQTCQIALTEITTQQFPMFEVSLIITVSIIIIILFILKLIGKLNINSIRKIKPRRMKKENIPKPPENVKYYYSKKDIEEAEKDKDKKENK